MVVGEGLLDLRGGPAALRWLLVPHHVRGVLASGAYDAPRPVLVAPGLAAGAHNQQHQLCREIYYDHNPRPPNRHLHGRGVRQGCRHERSEVPPGVVFAESTHMEAAHLGIRRNRWVQEADDPDSGRQRVQRRGIHIRELSRLPPIVFPETLPDEWQYMPRRSGVHLLRAGRLPRLALGPDHALQGRAGHRKVSFRAAEGLHQGRHCGGRFAASLDVHQRCDPLDAVMCYDGGRGSKVGLVDRAATQGQVS